MSEERKHKGFLLRFFIVWGILLLGMFWILSNIIRIQTKERSQWLALGDSLINRGVGVISPNRGNIYSADHQLMASSVPLYRLSMDTKVEYLRQNSDTAFYIHIDSLAYCLADYFKDKSKAEYKRNFIRAYKKGSRSYRFYKKEITYSQLKDIKKFPIFRRGQIQGGLIAVKINKRIKPYSSLAARTIGDVYRDRTRGGKNGFELAFDSILKGTPGISIRKKVANRWIDVSEIDPVDGFDIVSTINVDMQDIAEKALIKKLTEIDATNGYAILMEVKTGEVKAIVNMYKGSNGTYYEKRNGAVADKVEPGSTFKVASLMAVLDDGKATLNDTIDTGNGLYRFGNRIMRDHNAHRGGYGKLALENAINASSNVGISRTVYNAYGSNPAEFVDKLYEMGLNEPFQLYIPGSAKPGITHPNDTNRYWSATDLPWMSIGYVVQLAPIYTVAFYNAIANNGKFLEPLLVKSINQNGRVVKEFKARVIREQMCKPSVIEDVKKTLLGVVEHPKYATGRPAHSDIVQIAGKTGTAQISKGRAGYAAGGKSHQVSFCGFFPYENPKYSCIVAIREPKIGYPSGGRMAGPVVRDIAERIMAIDSKRTIADILPPDSVVLLNPSVKKGKSKAVSTVISGVEKTLMKTESLDSDWINVLPEGTMYKAEMIETDGQKIPDLRGMGAKDAIYICEMFGLHVKMVGVGRVYSQSIPKGTITKRGQIIELSFK